MSALRRGLALALLLSLGGCHWGTRPSDFTPATRPDGATVAVRVRGEPRDRVGELYAADTAGITLSLDRVTWIAWRRVAVLDVHGLGYGYDVPSGGAPDTAQRQRLALVSRFPQGLAGDLLARVLAARGQDALVRVE